MLPIIFVYWNKEEIEPSISVFSEEHGVPKTNIFSLIPEKRQLSIDQIREMKKQISIASPQKRLFVLYDLDSASPPAQNALLKTLEEKKADDYFLLFVTQLDLVVSTIRSRCNIRYIESSTPQDASPEMIELVQALLKNSIQVMSSPLVTNLTQEKGILFLDELLIALRPELSTAPEKVAYILKDILKTKSFLQSNNLNPQLAIDSLLLRAVKYNP